MAAQERIPIWPVGAVAMPADGTRLRGVPGVYGHDGDARQRGFVLQERTELEERPSRMSVALPFPNRCPSRTPLRSSRAIPHPVPLALATMVLLMRWFSCLRNRASLPASFLSCFLAPLVPFHWRVLRLVWCLRRILSTVSPVCTLPSESTAMLTMPKSTPRKSVGSIGHSRASPPCNRGKTCPCDRPGQLGLACGRTAHSGIRCRPGQRSPAAKNPETDFVQSFETEDAVVVADRRRGLNMGHRVLSRLKHSTALPIARPPSERTVRTAL